MIRLLLLGQGASFMLASLIHRGLLIDGYADAGAATPEMVIGSVLLLGLAATFVWPARLRPIALGAQGFALLGTCVGLFFVAMGIGPNTVPDVVYHLGIFAVLIWGLVATARTEREGSPA